MEDLYVLNVFWWFIFSRIKKGEGQGKEKCHVKSMMSKEANEAKKRHHVPPSCPFFFPKKDRMKRWRQKGCGGKRLQRQFGQKCLGKMLPCVQDSAFLPVIMYDQTLCDNLLFQACGCRHDISLDIYALSLTRNYHTASPHAMDTTCHSAAGYLFVCVLVCAQYVRNMYVHGSRQINFYWRTLVNMYVHNFFMVRCMYISLWFVTKSHSNIYRFGGSDVSIAAVVAAQTCRTRTCKYRHFGAQVHCISISGERGGGR